MTRRPCSRASAVARVAPLVVGTSEISAGGKLREVMVAGTVSQYAEVRNMAMAQGRFLTAGDWRRGASEAVIGAKVRDEIFGTPRHWGNWCALATGAFASWVCWAPAARPGHEHR
jgi:hypothetical protein